MGHPSVAFESVPVLDTLGEWQLKAPVVVADAGYGVSTPSGSVSDNVGCPMFSP